MDKIVILDYGSQYNEILLAKLRELGVYSLIVPKATTASKIKELKDVKGIILSGGPNVIGEELENSKDSKLFDEEILNLNVPVLGICYGMELLAHHFGAKVTSVKDREFDKHVIRLSNACPLFFNLRDEIVVYITKSDRINDISAPVQVVAESSSLGAVAFAKDYIYGVMWHPEVDASEEGKELLSNFIDICGCKKEWSLDNFLKNKIEEIREEVKDEKVILGLSGGIDSTVAALILHEAIGDNLTCLFVETGLHRVNEASVILNRFKEKTNIKLDVADEGELFLNRLKGVVDPEEKRKVIVDTFVEVFKKYANRLGNFKYLGQGTLYTDVKESKWGGKSKVISGTADDIGFEIIEPIKELTKAEVRGLARKLGLDEAFIKRQPFPFPGLAIRVIGEVTLLKLEILREANEILSQEVRKNHLETELYQYFCVLTNIDSTGVEGNNKIYYHTIAIRAVTSNNGINADFYKFDMNFLERVSRRIVNEVRGVNRVVYDITAKPPSTIEYQ